MYGVLYGVHLKGSFSHINANLIEWHSSQTNCSRTTENNFEVNGEAEDVLEARRQWRHEFAVEPRAQLTIDN
jgi:hypothetical protein